jgi:cyclophilin family peptidyl-prolyl cis-trans isomerase
MRPWKSRIASFPELLRILAITRLRDGDRRMPLWHFVACIVFFFGAGACLPSSAQENLPAIVRAAQPSVVLIRTYSQAGEMIAQGSGFFVDRGGAVLTNRHVLEGASRAEVKTAQGKVYAVSKVLAEDNEGDLIRVSVNVPPEAVRPLLVSTSLPEVGERILVIGSPLGLERTVSDGIVSAVRSITRFGEILQITAPISPGSSGSPVINMKGQAIGVATLYLLEGQSLNFAVPAARIYRMRSKSPETLAQWSSQEKSERKDMTRIGSERSANEVCVIETDFGKIVFEFFPDVAPKHVANFIKLANSGFYNGTAFHRVIPGFMIQGGDPNSKGDDRSTYGMGQPGQPTVPAEFSKISHKRGIVSAARRGNDINSATSQFFICVADAPFLDGQYSVFGRVIEGMDVVDKIVNVPRDQRDNPLKKVVMRKVYIKKLTK